MRREFILVLLGIICISTLSSLMSGYTQIGCDKLLLDTVVGVVGAGNFTYWQLGHSGPLLVELISLTGDADLYVADNIRPSYEVDRNNFSSATCGPDVVSVPVDFPRPIGIGVFGHWSHKASEYSIQVFLDTSTVFNEEVMVTETAQRDKTQKSDKEKSIMDRPARRSDDHKPRFMLRLLDLLDMIFEVFVI